MFRNTRVQASRLYRIFPKATTCSLLLRNVQIFLHNVMTRVQVRITRLTQSKFKVEDQYPFHRITNRIVRTRFIQDRETSAQDSRVTIFHVIAFTQFRITRRTAFSTRRLITYPQVFIFILTYANHVFPFTFNQRTRQFRDLSTKRIREFLRRINTPCTRYYHLFPKGTCREVVIVTQVQRVRARVEFIMDVIRVIRPTAFIQVSVRSANIRRVPQPTRPSYSNFIRSLTFLNSMNHIFKCRSRFIEISLSVNIARTNYQIRIIFTGNY